MIACRWAGRDNPRIITNRHTEQCDDNQCRGCLQCTEPHCRICAVTHVNGTCAECMAETREALHDIARMTNALPEEVEHRGVEGEAMMLLGPVADPEARGNLEASFKAGRIPHDAIESSHVRECEDPKCAGCAPELHPEFVCLSWQMVWRDALDHDEAPDSRLETAIDYLDRTMTYMGSYPYVQFEDFALDLRRCRTHLEAVLHDGEQVDQGAPCMSCGARLERPPGDRRECRHDTPGRRWLATLRTYPELQATTLEERAQTEPCGDCDQGGRGDRWECPRCHQSSSDDQYRFAVMHLHREKAEWLTDRDMHIRTGVKAGTVRAWSRPTSLRESLVEKRREGERTVYAVADVLKAAQDKGMVSKKEDPSGVDLREEPCMP